jgi:uncharacterized protein YjeT (DUF2065 family)
VAFDPVFCLRALGVVMIAAGIYLAWKLKAPRESLGTGARRFAILKFVLGAGWIAVGLFLVLDPEHAIRWFLDHRRRG